MRLRNTSVNITKHPKGFKFRARTSSSTATITVNGHYYYKTRGGANLAAWKFLEKEGLHAI